MLLHARKKTSLLFPVPSPPSPASHRGRGGMERPPAAPRAAAATVDTAEGSSVGLSPAPHPGTSRSKPQLRAPRDVRGPDALRAVAAASPAGFLFPSEVFSPTPLLLLLPPPLPLPVPFRLRAPPLLSRCGAEASACRAPRSSPGNFWTRCLCPLGEGEERRP